jgi:hypothetical protein
MYNRIVNDKRTKIVTRSFGMILLSFSGGVGVISISRLILSNQGSVEQFFTIVGCFLLTALGGAIAWSNR